MSHGWMVGKCSGCRRCCRWNRHSRASRAYSLWRSDSRDNRVCILLPCRASPTDICLSCSVIRGSWKNVCLLFRRMRLPQARKQKPTPLFSAADDRLCRAPTTSCRRILPQIRLWKKPRYRPYRGLWCSVLPAVRFLREKAYKPQHCLYKRRFHRNCLRGHYTATTSHCGRTLLPVAAPVPPRNFQLPRESCGHPLCRVFLSV